MKIVPLYFLRRTPGGRLRPRARRTWARPSGRKAGRVVVRRRPDQAAAPASAPATSSSPWKWLGSTSRAATARRLPGREAAPSVEGCVADEQHGPVPRSPRGRARPASARSRSRALERRLERDRAEQERGPPGAGRECHSRTVAASAPSWSTISDRPSAGSRPSRRRSEVLWKRSPSSSGRGASPGGDVGRGLVTMANRARSSRGQEDGSTTALALLGEARRLFGEGGGVGFLPRRRGEVGSRVGATGCRASRARPGKGRLLTRPNAAAFARPLPAGGER